MSLHAMRILLKTHSELECEGIFQMACFPRSAAFSPGARGERKSSCLLAVSLSGAKAPFPGGWRRFQHPSADTTRWGKGRQCGISPPSIRNPVVPIGLEHCSFMSAGMKCLFIVLFYFQTGAFYVAQVSLEFSVLLPHLPSSGFQMLNRTPASLVDF